MAGQETLSFNILGNASSAARAFKDTADSAALAAKGAVMASDAMKLQAKTAEVSAGATLALARADKILSDAELGLARDTAVANAVLGRQNTALLGSSTAGAVGSMLAAAASGRAPSGGGGTGGMAPGIAMAAAALGIARQQTRLFSDSISAGTPVWDSARKGIFGLNGELQLFGGALTSVGIPHILSAATTVHLLSEAVIETAGTLVPAAIAFSVFAAAAVPAAMSVYTQMSNLHTVSAAFGTQMPGLSGGFSKMAAAVQPQVYQLFGEALVFANSGTGQLQGLATGAGKVLDDLGARFVFATTQGKGFSDFIGKAASDLAGWGNLVGNIGGIFGNVLKVLPGYAEDILSVLQGVTHGIEAVTGSGLGQWVLGIGLAAHGALFYIGILGTGLAVLASRGLAAVAPLALSAATAVEGLGVAGEAASGGLLAFAGAAEGAAALPWGWISIAAAGIGFLVYQLVSAKDAAQQFNASMQSAITSAPLNQLSATISSSIAQTQARVTVSSRQMAAALKDSAAAQNQAVFAGRAGQIQNQATSEAVTKSAQSTRDYTQGLTGLQQQQSLVAGRVNALAKEYGGQTQALAALNAAGITSAQITDTSSAHWAQYQIEIKAANLATREMGISTGALGSDYVNTVLPAVQKVTQAQDAAMNAILGGEQGFIAWGQGLQQASKDARAGGASLSGLNAQSLTLANDWYGTLVPAAQKLNDALEAQGASLADRTTALADEVKQMLPFTAGNIAAKSVLVDLVNNALNPGTVSLQTLSSWTAKNSGTMAGFQAIVGKATVAAGNLAGTLTGLLNSAFAADLLRASGASDAVNAYARALTSSGNNAQATRTARANLITDLEKAGYSAQQATGYVNGLQTKIDALRGKSVGVQVVGSGSGQIYFNERTGVGANVSGGLKFMAGGGAVAGSGPAGVDSVPIMAAPGEFVINAGSAAKIGLPALAAMNSFASGGLVGPASVLNTGVPFEANAGASFAKTVEAAFANAALAALKKSVASAATAAGTPVAYSGVAGVTQWEPDVSRVLSMLGLPQGDLPTVMAQILTESGGNPNAINNSDINAQQGDPSRGLMQVIGTTFAAYRNPSLSGNIYDPLANIYAGLNYAVHRYGNPGWLSVLGHGHGYDSGGYLPTGWSLAYNGTGRPEPVIPAARGGAAGAGPVVLEVAPGGGSAFEQFMLAAIREWVRVKGGGDVQRAFGRQ